MNAVRHDGSDAPLDPVPGVGYAERAVPDAAHGRVRVRVGRRHKWREALGLGHARRHLGVHEQRGLQSATSNFCQNELVTCRVILS